MAALAAAAVGFASWFPMEFIEDGALRNPDHSTGALTVPLYVKGVVRYVTPTEARVDGLAQMTFVAGVLTAAALGVTLREVRRRARLSS